MPSSNLASLGGGSNNFLPTFVSGLALWLDASQLSGLNDGDAMSSWTDMSGNSRHATGTTTQRPTYKTGIVNGKAVARFNGSSNGLVTGNVDFTGTSAVTVFCVASCISGSDRAMVELTTSTAAVTNGFVLFRQTTSNKPVAFIRGDVGNSVATHDVAMSGTSTFRLVSAKFDKSLSTNEAVVWVNGGWSSTISNSNNTNAFANAPIYIGSRAQSSLFWSGDIAEVLIYNRALTATERLQVQGYLNDKYALYFAANATTVVDTADTSTITDAFVGDTVLHHSNHARMVFTTSATSIEVATYNNLYPDFAAFTQVGIRSNGVTVATLAPGSNGEKLLTNSLPAGTNKTVEVIAGLQSKPSSTVNGTFLKSVTFPGASASLASVTTTPRLYLYGDSITSGANATSTPLDAWGQLLRANYTDVLIDAYGYRTLYDDANTSNLRAALVSRIAATNPTLIWLAIGTNDYSLNKWSAASFGTAYAALLDDLHTALPSATIYCQTPIVRTTETANGSGSTLGNYRTQISTAQSTRSSYAVLVDGTAFMTTASLDDGVHPTTAGHTTYYNAVKTVLGI